MNNLLKIEKISKNYHSQQGEIEAIKNLSFDVNEGEFIAIVGSSGCGKSTLLNIIAGLEKQSSGTLKIKDNKSIGYMLQQDALFPWLTIKENVLLGLKIQKKVTNDKLAYADYLLDSYNLGEFKDKYPSCLSGGMRQRVALIRTLVLNPEIILLDEPFSALDYQTRLAVSDDVYKIIKKEKKTAIMVTHDLAEAISMADKIIVLTKRPAIIKKIYDINLTNKSNPIENRKAKEFAYYYDLIWKDIDAFVK